MRATLASVNSLTLIKNTPSANRIHEGLRYIFAIGLAGLFSAALVEDTIRIAIQRSELTMGSTVAFAKRGVVVACLVALGANAFAGWSYGVLTDTQGAGQYPLVSTRLMEPVVDRFVNHHGVDMVMSVGDLTDAGGPAEFDLWRQTAAPIYNAGIPIYATRGNHDVKNETEIPVVDPLFGPVDIRDTAIWDSKMTELSAPGLIQGPGASYMFSHNNAFFMAVDLYGAAPSELIGWLQSTALPAAAASGAEHKVLYQHEPYLRQGPFRRAVGGSRVWSCSCSSGMSAAGVDTILTRPRPPVLAQRRRSTRTATSC
jgi:hypothetical protein